MADLDEISQAIGQIQSTLQDQGRAHAAMFNKLDKVTEEQYEQRGAIKLLSTQHLEMKKEHANMAAMIAPVVHEIEAAKNKGKGVMLGLTLSGVGGMAGLVSAFQTFIGKGHG